MNIKSFDDYEQYAGYDEYESAILHCNGIDREAVAEKLPDIGKSYSMSDFPKAMRRLKNGESFVDYIEAHKNSKYCIIGDYDCDGIMATVIMCYSLTLCGIDCTFICPDRFSDGYGMQRKHIDAALKSGADAIITVDNGISANDAIDYAHEKGLYVLVTDHHNPQGENHADICIDPWCDDDDYHGSSGATVAFKLACLLYERFGFEEKLLYDLEACAAITVFSDVMPMLGENRILVKAALPYMSEQSMIPGSFIERLADLLDFTIPGRHSDRLFHLNGTYRDFDGDNIDFYLVPVINACNRVIGNVDDLVYDIMSLFISDYQGVPHAYSDINTKRKYMRTELTGLHRRDDKTNAVVEILDPPNAYDCNYAGIVGLVASNIVDKEKKPAMIGVKSESGDGMERLSGRSVRGFDLFSALSDIKSKHPELRFSFGGHAEALGCNCHENDIASLQKYLSEEFAAFKTNAKPEESEDSAIGFGGEDINGIIGAYRRLYPFGNGFTFPKLYSESSVYHVNAKERTFTMTKLGNALPVVTYDSGSRRRLENGAFRERSKRFRCVFTPMQDARGNIVLKLLDIL